MRETFIVLRSQTGSKTQADDIVEAARRRAAHLIAEAEQKAEETAGQALKALHEAEQLDGLVKALKNRIEGYGDEYLELVPKNWTDGLALDLISNPRERIRRR
jgi:regulator of protease activity HflC (stomatin/prohibitin superfamily)